MKIAVKLITIVFCCIQVSSGDTTNNRMEPEASSWRFSSRLLTNPVVQNMVDSVSAQNIFTDVQILASYYTRHTNSETTSANLGIGATRRWIYDRFQTLSADSTTYSLIPDYFTFDATVCGIPGQHKNVMATFPGTTRPDRHFIIMGHMDSRTVNGCDAVSYAPSANDDGSGTAVVMEIARVLARYSFESTIIVMPVTGEDEGLYGSTAYAQWASSHGFRIDGVISNDVVGNIEGCSNPSCPPGEPVITDSLSVRHFSGGPETGISRQLTRYMKLKAMEYVPGFDITLIPALDRPGRSGDHVPFFDRGYAGVRFTEAHENGDGTGYNGRQHNANDTVSAINTNAGYMANIVRINIAGFASLALAPQTPTGRLTASNTGDGTSVLLEWTNEQNEPDFAGFRIAVRPQGELFYTDVIDVGNVSSYVVRGLTYGQTVFLSMSAYDTDENESIFTSEISFTPSGIPEIPSGFESISQRNFIDLSWSLNNEMDIMGYRIFRQAPGQEIPTRVAELLHPAIQWSDSLVSPHVLYRYFIAAVDSSQHQSNLSNPVFGQLVTLDNGVIIIDGTLDGSGRPLVPTDLQVDNYYDSLLIGYNITGRWDVFDSTAINRQLTDADLAPFSTVFMHCDRSGTHLESDTSTIRKYLANGGHLIISGWNLSCALAGNTNDFVHFQTTEFFSQYLKIDSLGVSPSSNNDFVAAPSLLPLLYPDLGIDSAKVSILENRLFKMEAFLELVNEPLVEPLYEYRSSMGENSPLDGLPLALRYLGDDYKTVIFDVPLYFMNMASAAAVLRQALTDVGEMPTLIDYNPTIPNQIGLIGNYPNPFNSSTIINYYIPTATHVSIGIYDILGRRITVLLDGQVENGGHSLSWSPNDYPSGIYFCKFQAGNITQTSRMVLVK